MHHIIFDMDGVLSDSWDAVIESLIPTGLHGHTREDVLRNHWEYTISKPHHTIGGSMTPQQQEQVTTGLKQLAVILNHAHVPLFQRFIDEIKKIDGTFAVVSSNSGDYVYEKAKETGLPFTHVLAWEDNPHKEEKIKKVCTDWGVDPHSISYVTDTLADVYELETIMLREHIIGCPWGYCGYAVLREELPKEQILKNPKDIHKVLSRMKVQ